MSKQGSIGDGDHSTTLDTTFPAIGISNRVVQRPSTSNSDIDTTVFVEDEHDISGYITDDEKMYYGNNESYFIDSNLENFLQKEDELRKLMSLNNFNQILNNEIEFSEKDEYGEGPSKLNEEDSTILTNLEAKLLDIQKRYNALMDITVIESESEEEDKVEEDLLEFEEAHKKLQEIDKCLESINNEKYNESPENYLKSLSNEDTKYVEKEYLNSLNEMTKKLDSLGSDELEEFLDGGLLTCDDVLGLK